jgi:hypothetical protein
MAEGVADKFLMSAMTNDAVEHAVALLAQTAPVAPSAAAARYAARQTLATRLTRIVESSEDELSSVHPSFHDLGPWREQAAWARAEAEQARDELAAQAEAIEEEAAHQTPTDDGNRGLFSMAARCSNVHSPRRMSGRSRAVLPTQICGRSMMA